MTMNIRKCVIDPLLAFVSTQRPKKKASSLSRHLPILLFTRLAQQQQQRSMKPESTMTIDKHLSMILESTMTIEEIKLLF